MSDSGGSGAHYFQNGVWLSKGESDRSDRYQRWSDEKTKSKFQNLDRQQHSNLVRINSECLQMRSELRELQQEKRQRTRRHNSSGEPPADGVDSPSSTSLTSSASVGVGRGLRKSPSTGSIVSSSSGYSSMSSPHSVGRSLHSSGGDRGAEGGVARAKLYGGSSALNPDVVALKIKNLHSARSLSKLKNDMEVL